MDPIPSGINRVVETYSRLARLYDNYLYSLFAFHWASDPAAAVKELARVLKPNAEMDLFFIGRNNGREFIRRTTSIFLKYMGPGLLLQSAQIRKQLTKQAAVGLFSQHFHTVKLRHV